MYQEALDMRVALFGENHPDSIASRENLESILMEEAMAVEKSDEREQDNGSDYPVSAGY